MSLPNKKKAKKPKVEMGMAIGRGCYEEGLDGFRAKDLAGCPGR